MIMIVSDTHCYYNIVNKQIEHAENVLGIPISCVIHLGDFGLYRPQMHDYFVRKGNRFIRPLYCIDGNHEDFKALPKLAKKYNAFFTYMPRATTHTIGAYRFLALGGTAYMDSMITERGAIITDYQINQCLSIPPRDIDIILTHDCPEGIGVPNTPGLEHFGDTGFPRSGELAEHFKPKLWLFGHHHKWFSSVNKDTSYQGIGGVWRGFGLLDEDYRFSVVHHTVEWEKTPFIEKFLMKLRIIRPDSPNYK